MGFKERKGRKGNGRGKMGLLGQEGRKEMLEERWDLKEGRKMVEEMWDWTGRKKGRKEGKR